MAKVINHFIPKPPNLGTKTVTENGTVTAASDGLDGFSQVTVNVQGGGGWQPDPLWTDIRTLWDEDTLRKKVASGVTFYSDTALTTSVGTLASSHPVTSVEATYGTIIGDGTDGTSGTTYYVAIADVTGDYIYSAIYLISASDLTTTFLSGARYITSDGYDSGTVLATNYTHTWDLDDDMVDSTGAYTRWIKVYTSVATTAPYNFNNTVMWIINNLSIIVNGPTSKNTSQYLAFCNGLQCVEIKENITKLSVYAFRTNRALQNIIINTSVTEIESAFYYCYSLPTITLPHGIISIGEFAFYYCYSLRAITLPNTVTNIGTTAFTNCSGLTVVTLESGFDVNLNIPYSDLYSRQTLNAMIAAYKDNSGEGGTARTLTIGATNLAKLTAEDKAVATAKNLTLA